MYALAAIPIWFAKMGMLLGGLAIITKFVQNAIGWLTNKFEDLLYFDFSTLLSGNKDNSNSIMNYDGHSDKFHFFPSVTSPFFILWIVFLSAALIMLVVLILFTLIKKMSSDEDEVQQKNALSFLASFGGAVVSIFFIPVVVFSSMTLTSTGARALFKTSENTSMPEEIQEYQSVFYQNLTKTSQDIYNLGSKNDLLQSDGSENAIYSHTSNNTVDNIDHNSNKNPTVIHPFSKSIDIFKRMSMELSYLDKDSDKYFDSSTQLDITQTKQAIDKYVADWYSKDQIKVLLASLASGASNARTNNKDHKLSMKLDNQKDQLTLYVKDSLGIFNDVRKLIDRQNDFKIGLSSNSQNEVLSKVNGIFNKSNPTQNINYLQSVQNSKESASIQRLIAYANLFSLTKVYLAPENFGTRNDWSGDYAYSKNMPWSSDTTLIGSMRNVVKMITGYKIGKGYASLQGLAVSYASHKKTSLSEVIDEIQGIGGSNVFVNIAMVFVSWAVAGLILTILFQLWKRLLMRIFKLLFLWITGAWTLVIGASQGTQAIKTWFSMVLTEMVVLIGLGLGWQLWKILTPMMFQWIDGGGSASLNTSTGLGVGIVLQGIQVGDSLGIVFGKIFIAIGLLELVVKGTDWLQESLGGTASMSQIRNNVTSGAQRAKSNITGKRTSAKSTDRVGTNLHNKVAKSNFGQRRGMKQKEGLFGMSNGKPKGGK